MSERKRPHIWVIEIDDGNFWKPCADASLNKADARDALRDWAFRLPNDKLRIAKYVRQNAN